MYKPSSVCRREIIRVPEPEPGTELVLLNDSLQQGEWMRLISVSFSLDTSPDAGDRYAAIGFLDENDNLLWRWMSPVAHVGDEQLVYVFSDTAHGDVDHSAQGELYGPLPPNFFVPQNESVVIHLNGVHNDDRLHDILAYAEIYGLPE